MSYTRIRSASVTAALMALVLTARAPAADVADDNKFLPADTNLLVVMKMDQLVASDGFKKLLKEIPMLEKEMTEGFEHNSGVKMDTVAHMQMGGNLKGKPITVLWLKKAVKIEDVRKAREQARFPGDKGATFKEVKVGTFTLFEPTPEFRDSFCLVDDNTILSGEAKELKAVLERNKKMDFSAEMQTAVQTADPKATIAILYDMKSLGAGDNKNLFVPIPGFDMKQLIEHGPSAALTVKLGQTVDVRWVSVCPNPKSADLVKNQFDQAITSVEKLMKDAPNMIPKEIVELPKKVKTATNGNLAEASLSVSPDMAVTFFKTMTEGRGSAPPPPKPEKP